MRRILCALVLFALPLGACGTSGGGRGGFESFLAGPARFLLPLFQDASQKTLALRNLVDRPATVTVTALPGGLPVVVAVNGLPGRGETWLPATSFGVASPRWLLVDTTAGDTTGFVEPYLFTTRSGPDRESVYGALLQQTESVIPVHPQTDVISLVNVHGAPVMYDVRHFAANDIPTMPSFFEQVVVPANGSVDLASFFGTSNVGHISVVPTAPAPAYAGGDGFTLAAHQIEGLVVEVDDRDETRNDVTRLLDANGTLSAEFMVEWGRDPVTGGYEDFDLQVSNFTDLPAAFTVQSIYDEFGTPVKVVPSTFTVPGRQSRLFATTLVDSLGLQLGEVHPFAHAFGDVFVSADRRLYRMNLSVDASLLFAGRGFDPLALDFVTGIRPTAVRRTTSVLTNDLQTTTAGGIANWVYLSNPTNAPVVLTVRAFTAERGTEYSLPSLVVPAQGITRFRGDGLGLKEEPGVPILADVPIVRFLFSSNTPFGTRGRGESRNGAGLLVFVTPHIVRHEE